MSCKRIHPRSMSTRLLLCIVYGPVQEGPITCTSKPGGPNLWSTHDTLLPYLLDQLGHGQFSRFWFDIFVINNLGLKGLDIFFNIYNLFSF